MSLIAVGVSHRSAPLPLLERAAVGAADPGFRADLAAGTHLSGAIVLATCNRIEIYADTDRFHGGVGEVAGVLARHSDVALDTLAGFLYAHYDAAAAEHLFTVTAGLDSMAVGESQILGQVRTVWQDAHAAGVVSRELDEVFQQALRVGKRAQRETGLDRLSNSLVEHALDRSEAVLGGPARRVVLVGAGAMAAVVAASLGRRWDVADAPARLVVANRNRAGADRLAAGAGAPAGALSEDVSRLPELLRSADLVICCTGAVGHVLEGRLVAEARGDTGAPLVLLDLALPRDVDPLAEQVRGVTVIDLERLGADLAGLDVRPEAAAARAVVTEEVALWRAARAAADVAPTVVALREQAEAILDAELARLRRRLPDLSSEVAAEVERAVRRSVDKVLHTPTVRVKQLADAPGGTFYAEALRTLFDLEVSDVASVDRVLR